MAERGRKTRATSKTPAKGRRRKAEPRRLGRPPDTSSAETRQRVIEVARRHFGDFGYDTTTNKGVAHDADITTGAIYHYFESKEDLYRTVADEAAETIFGRFEAALEGVDGCVAKLHAALECALALEKQDPTLASFIVSVPVEARRHPELADVARAQSGRNIKFFRAILEEGLATGEIARDVDIDAVSEMVSAMMGGLARHATLVQNYDRHALAIVGFQRLIEGNLFAQRSPRLVRQAARKSG
jgi:AcrR family transcriptional regulator